MSETSFMCHADGSIYHLRLHPGELAHTVILVGDPDRVDLITSYFDRIELTRRHREFNVVTGEYQGRRLSVVSTGIGTGSIDIVLNELDALVNMDFKTRAPKSTLTALRLVRFGTAGSLQPDIPVGSLVVSSHAFALDGLLNFYCSPAPGQATVALRQQLVSYLDGVPGASQLYISAADPGLLQCFSAVAHSGITFTCAGFYGPQGRILRAPIACEGIIERVSKFSTGTYRVTNFEMETAAIYGLGRVLGHRCCSISAIVANRRAEKVGAYKTVVSDMIEPLLQQLCSENVSA